MSGFKPSPFGYQISKSPDDVLDYCFDWTMWLAGDAIIRSTFTVDQGVDITDTTRTDVTATVWLANGVSGQFYIVVNKIVTSDGRTAERSFRLNVRNP